MVIRKVHSGRGKATHTLIVICFNSLNLHIVCNLKGNQKWKENPLLKPPLVK